MGITGRYTHAPDGFHVVPLPYADDLRVLPPEYRMSKADRPDADAIKKAEALLNQRVGLPEFFADLEQGMFPNPSLLQQFAHIEAHALSKEVDEEDPVTNIVAAKKNLEPLDSFGKDPDIKERAEALMALRGRLGRGVSFLPSHSSYHIVRCEECDFQYSVWG